MSLSELMGKLFEAENGESFIVDKIGTLFANKVKKEKASLDTSHGTVDGAVIIDYDNKMGLVGYDKTGQPRVLGYRDGAWHGGALSLKDSKGNLISLSVGNDGFEQKELAMAESIDEKAAEDEVNISVLIKDTKHNKELYPDLIGKLGKVIKKKHSEGGLRVDVLVGKRVYNMDWTDVKSKE